MIILDIFILIMQILSETSEILWALFFLTVCPLSEILLVLLTYNDLLKVIGNSEQSIILIMMI